ncbi:MAG: L-threonylcarbamoyladenylate synthase [Patescibacteria group bacterium]
MKTIKLSAHNVEETVATAVEFLIEGGVVLFPTDTSYGLAADAAREEAVEVVLRLKQDISGKPLSVITDGRRQAEAITTFNPAAARLWDRFMPGPLTLVLPVSTGAGLVPQCVGEGQAVGVRYPDYPFAAQLAERLERPYTATSANLSGRPPAFTPEEFLEQVEGGELPHLVIDAGSLPIRPVSTVVDVTDGVRVLREAAISEADIIETVG